MLEPSTTTINQLAKRWNLTLQQIIEAAIAGQIGLYFRLGNCAIADLPNPTPGNKLRRRPYQGYLRADKATLESILNDGEARYVQEAYLSDGQWVYVELPPQEVVPAAGEHAMPIQMSTPLTIKTDDLHALMEEVKADKKALPVSTMSAQTAKPVQRSTAQDAAILAALQAMGVDSLAVPKNSPGKPGTKAKVRSALNGNPLFTGTTVFDKAWERLTHRKEIVISA